MEDDYQPMRLIDRLSAAISLWGVKLTRLLALVLRRHSRSILESWRYPSRGPIRASMDRAFALGSIRNPDRMHLGVTGTGPFQLS